MSVIRHFLESRGISPAKATKMEIDKIDVDVITEMSDEELKEYIPCKGDRVAIKAFARKEQTSLTEPEKKKMSLIESLRNRMTRASKPIEVLSDDDDDEEVQNPKTRSFSPKQKRKKVGKLPFFPSLSSRKTGKSKQSTIASKDDVALVVGFCISDRSTGYRQVRAPMGGGTRHIRVEKDLKKLKLLDRIRPLFFPNMHGSEDEFIFDVSTDVKGTQVLRENESLEKIMNRLGLKHFRCYLLARLMKNDNSDSVESIPEVINDDDDDDDDDDIAQSNFSVVTNDVMTSVHQRNDTDDLHIPKYNEILDKESDKKNENSLGTYKSVLDNVDNVDLTILPEGKGVVTESTSVSSFTGIPAAFVTEDILARAANESGIIQFGSLPSDGVDMNDTVPLMSEIKVHRGLVCRDLIEFFSKDENIRSDYLTFEIKMLREDGTPEVAEDNGGVMRDALTEFWDTFYMQYTEGNSYKVPVLRHDMSHVQWKAVAAVIQMGFVQEKVYPIKLAPSFMQQAIFGSWNRSDLVESFLRFVSLMDKNVLETALKDFTSIEEEDINDVMEQYDPKKIIKADNVDRIVFEIAEKELVQKPAFVAKCFYELLHTSPLVLEDISAIYSKLQPNPKKVLNSLKFPEQMNQEETLLSVRMKKFVREMDDPEMLGLFLRFCTGCDVIIDKDIQIRFTSSGASDNVRCPSSHTCGCVLEIPRSYAKDEYVTLKSDFLALLKNRYWQMDFV